MTRKRILKTLNDEICGKENAREAHLTDAAHFARYARSSYEAYDRQYHRKARSQSLCAAKRLAIVAQALREAARLLEKTP